MATARAGAKLCSNIFDVGRWSGLTEVLFMERCLNLLKPGGRLGIVLPEGVLNNSALQKVRDYVEGRAKLINITSIPQDVFIASGATVKPSLLFLKKFTEQEERDYRTLVDQATRQVYAKYQPQLDELKKKFTTDEKSLKEAKDKEGLKALRKQYREDKKRIDALVTSDIRAIVKDEFDYPIPVIEVAKAGISSTGAPCENELVEAAREFTQYRQHTKLWDEPLKEIRYDASEDGQMYRIPVFEGATQEPEVFYGS